MLLPIVASAGNEIDGIYYALDATGETPTATVLDNPNKYSGDVVIPESVTFEEVSYSVTSIGEYAFEDCSGLTSITIPNSVTSIGEGAFYGCSGLTSVTIPNSVTSIGWEAFYGCSGLTSITIPNNVTAIASYTFYNCSDLTSITIPNSVTSIGEGTFSGCSGLTTITIPNSVTSIGEWAFSGCSGLTSITIPNNLTAIESSTFENCSSLTSVTIPNSVISIGNGAFRGCSGLTSITIPNSVTNIGWEAFHGTAWYKNQPDGLVYVGKIAYKYKGTMPANTRIRIKDGTLAIVCEAFKDCSGLTSITIPNSVTNIGWEAFSGCSGLTSITIPNNVTAIESSTFSGCSSLTSATIPNSVISIGNGAFRGCSSLTSITIPNSVVSIGDEAFRGCSGLTSVILNSNSIVSTNRSDDTSLKTVFGNQVAEYTIGKNVTSIGEMAFYGCSGLTSITIPNSVTSIGASAFYGCSNLTKAIFNSVDDFCYTTFGNKEANPLYLSHHLYVGEIEQTVITVPTGISMINDYAFAGGSEITKVTIPESVNYIGKDAFYGCNNNNLTIGYATDAQLKSMTYGDGESNPMSKAKMFLVNGNEITEVSFDADVNEKGFKGAKWLQKVTLNAGVTKIGKDAFHSCSKLGTVIFNNAKITEIGSDAFNNCQNLSIIKSEGQNENELPSTLETIGIAAFRYCTNLGNITIPSSVTSIGNETFYGCSGLTKVDIQANLTAIPNQMFYGCSNLAEVQLSNTIQTINYKAFYGCYALKSLPNVTTIGQQAYASCQGFTILTLPTTIKSIGEMAFAYCNNITDLMIPEKVSELNIGEKAFYVETGMGNLKRIYSYSLTAPGANATAFEGQTDIQLFYPEGGTGYDQVPWSYFNPTIFHEQTITWYEDNNTGDNFYRKELVQVGQPIPDITNPTRDGWTFAGWQWPDGNVLILMPNYPLELRGYFTAKKNHNTTGITYKLRSDNKQAIVVEDENVNSNIESVVIGPSVTFDNINYTIVAINARAFKGAKKLTSADISGATNLTSVGNAVFAECSSLGIAKLRTQATEIPDSMFYGCENLTTMDIPAGIITIGASAFNTCSVYNNVELPSSLKNLSELAFCKSGVLEISLPKSLETMGNRVFLNCGRLKKVEFDKDMQLTTLPDNTFKGCSKLEDFTLPLSMKTIGEAAFSGCSSLKRLVLNGTGIQAISANAFNGCYSIEEITLPTSIGSLGANAFESCNSIEKIAINNPDPPSAASNTFTNTVFSNASLYVTDDSKYKTHAFWKQFMPRIYTMKSGDVNGDGVVNVTDIVATVNYIMEKPSDGFNKEAADLNGDGEINVTDIVKMVSIIMSGESRQDLQEVMSILKSHGFIFKGER